MNKPFLDDLTVYVIVTGEETMSDCLDSLNNQDCGFQIETIKDVYPMSAAFQAMPDRCSTKYFVQVDADMLLKPHAVSLLHSGIRCTNPMTYAVLGMLYEEGFGPGGAVKCWKRGFFRFFSFHDCRTVDRDLFQRARRFGFKRHVLSQEVIGIHRPRHSPYSAYLKAKADVEKWRFLERPPDQQALPLVSDILNSPHESRHRLLGILCGSLTGACRLVTSKNARIERQRWERLLSLLGQGVDLSRHQIKLSVAESQQVCDSFVRCYNQLRETNVSARQAGYLTIAKLFSAANTFDSSALERILDE